MGLRHEAGAADGHLHAAAFGVLGIGVVEVYHLLGGLGDALDVLHRLGGKAHHEVELDGGVAVGKGQRAGLFDLVPGDVLIDDVAQALGAGLSGKGQAALAHLGGFSMRLWEKLSIRREGSDRLTCSFGAHSFKSSSSSSSWLWSEVDRLERLSSS